MKVSEISRAQFPLLISSTSNYDPLGYGNMDNKSAG
jgi:hypothetical protein